MARTPALLTRIDPEYAPLWRDGDTLQFGLNSALRTRVAEPWIERLVARLTAGMQLSTFDVVAHALGAPREEARALLEMLRPVLRTDPPPAPSVWIENSNLADSRVETWMRASLIDFGIEESARAAPTSIGIILVHGAVAAAQMIPYLREDLAHLPVAFDAGGVNVGPLVRPGLTPCLACRDGHDRDRDPAWPLLHCQLVGRADSPIGHPLAAEAADLVHRLLRNASPGGAQTDSPHVRFSSDGTRHWSSVRFHAECRCREQSFRSPRENATPPARIDPIPAPRTA